ncbi:MAG: gliding motility-associated C-terminal domain-containing protein [Flavobacteriaceae bacterium]|nr:gliding motility-associated C-terminal domain-containing protein [Flavobacteriaceae bacterium]
MTKKLFYFVLMWCFSYLGIAQGIQVFEPVDVSTGDPDDDQYTLFELIDQVLVQGECKVVDNVESPNNSRESGLAFDSFGYFDGEGTAFPFDRGIVMASTNINQLPPNPPFGLPGGSWGGDNDLSLLGGPANTNNATVITFDFVPFQQSIEFNYVMASTEYSFPSYPCTFADIFAFILSGPGIEEANFYNIDGNPNNDDVLLDLGGLNIATLPGTNIPATITNVHNVTCLPGQYAGDLGVFAASQFYDGNNPATSFDGQTIPLTASADVIPGEIYTIKLAVADYSDTILPTAVFLEGQSFSIGDIDLGDDLTFINPETECDGDPVLLESDFPLDTGILNYAWTINGEEIEGADGPSLEVDETGLYTLFVFVLDPIDPVNNPPVCFNSGQVFVDFFPRPDVDLPTTELICPGESVTLDATPNNQQDLDDAIADAEGIIDDIIENPDLDIEDFDITIPELSYQWFFNGEALEGETNFTLTPDEPGIYDVEVEFANCFDTYTVEVDFVEFNFVGQTEALVGCISEDGLSSFVIEPEIEFLIPSEENADVTFEWNTGDTTQNLEVSESGEYELTVTVNGCQEVQNYQVVLSEGHNVTVLDRNVCYDEFETTFMSGYDINDSDTNISWNLPDGSTQNSSNLTLTWNNINQAESLEGEYSVTVTIDECEITEFFTFAFTRQDEGEGPIIESCVIPEGISPNGDGINDSFDLTFLNETLGVEKLEIFNRYGRKVYEASNYTNEFFGQDQGGSNLVTGTYFYVIKLRESNDSFSRSEKGWLYINREQ